VVKGSVVALQKYQQAVFVPVPTSAQVVVPELKESALHQLLSDNVALGTDKKNPIIAKLITDVSQDRIRKTVEHLSSYYTRLSTSRPGTFITIYATHDTRHTTHDTRHTTHDTTHTQC
jgi:hypothetical protein